MCPVADQFSPYSLNFLQLGEPDRMTINDFGVPIQKVESLFQENAHSTIGVNLGYRFDA